jgi:hypothetical protein
MHYVGGRHMGDLQPGQGVAVQALGGRQPAAEALDRPLVVLARLGRPDLLLLLQPIQQAVHGVRGEVVGPPEAAALDDLPDAPHGQIAMGPGHGLALAPADAARAQVSLEGLQALVDGQLIGLLKVLAPL